MSNFDSLFAAAEDASTVRTGGSFPKIDVAGDYKVKVLESSFGKNQAGTAMRGFAKVEVIENLGDSPDRVGARTNLYLTVSSTQEQTDKNLAGWIKTILDLGVSAEKLKDDAADYLDIIQNMTTIMTKQLKLGKEIVVWLNVNPNSKKEGDFHKNVYSIDRYVPKVVDPVENAPAVEEDIFA